MQMSGEYTITATRQQVWDALNDPEALKQSIPGCDSIERNDDNELTATVTAKVGPVKAKFQGVVRLSDLNPPISYRISGEGKGGAAGFAKGGAEVQLDEADGGQATLLKYAVDASVGCKLAQIGARLIDSTAKKLAAEFFENFATYVVANAPAERPDAAMAPSPTPEATQKAIPETVGTPVPMNKTDEFDTHTEETVMSKTPEGVPEENVYNGTHWMVYLTIIASIAGIAALLLTSWAR